MQYAITVLVSYTMMEAQVYLRFLHGGRCGTRPMVWPPLARGPHPYSYSIWEERDFPRHAFNVSPPYIGAWKRILSKEP